jgi:glycosyltransferase involved in cell wall biosynthesis
MKQTEPVRISFIITSLGTGGAEMMLYKLLSRIDRKRFRPEVITLAGSRPATSSLVGRYQALDIPVRIFDFSKIWALPFRFVSLVRHLRGEHPHLVSTWMYHADLIGGVAARFAGNPPVAWNIRHSDLNRQVDKRTTLLTVGICGRLSRYLPVKIICCAHRAQDTHAALGYDRERMVVIPNGFDVEEFRPDSESRDTVRGELGLGSETLAIGLVGRFHPQKGHETFIQAAKMLIRKFSRVRFILCGNGVNWENRGLADLIEGAGLKEHFSLLGLRSDMSRLFSALDVVTSSSVCGEGFSNVIGEAMSCAVPCVVTDVGDSAMIVEETGKVVSSQNPEALSEAWMELIDLGREGRQALGRLARRRILQHFSLDQIVKRYEDLFFEILYLKS